MMEADNIPTLLVFLFGDGASQAGRMAPERLLRWSRAFDAWLAEIEHGRSQRAYNNARLAWKRFLEHTRKMPWEARPEDIEEFIEWQLSIGLKRSTSNLAATELLKFYRWCAEREIDPECGLGFNPAARARRRWSRKNNRTRALSDGQLRRLLEFMGQMDTPVGLRNYALALACLQLDVSSERIVQLKWGQVEPHEPGAWVTWKPGATPACLPEATWEAILAYLKASGRIEYLLSGPDSALLPTYRQSLEIAGQYLFAQLHDPEGAAPAGDRGGQAEDWNARECVSTRALETLMQQYGQLLDIHGAKLTLRGLQSTARLLGQEEILKALPASTPVQESAAGLTAPRDFPGGTASHLPETAALPSFPGQPPKSDTLAWKDAHAGGWLQEIIDRMRSLANRLVGMVAAVDGVSAKASLLDAHVLMVARISELVGLRREREKTNPDDEWVQDFKDFMEMIVQEEGHPAGVFSREIEEGAAELANQPYEEISAEIGALRASMGSFFEMAMQVDAPADLVRLANAYGKSSLRLVKLMKSSQVSENMEKVYIWKLIDEALDEATAEILQLWGEQDNGIVRRAEDGDEQRIRIRFI